MKKFLFILTTVLSVAFLAAATAGTPALIDLDFSKKCNVTLKGKARIAQNTMLLDGQSAFALIPGSENINVTAKGLTLTATVKLDYDPEDKALPGRVDMFFSKNKAFIFGKLHDKLYVNISDARKWCAHTTTSTLPSPGEWAHIAAVFERFYDPAQSDVGYRVSIYVNGELEISQKHPNISPAFNKNLIELGRGFGGGPWLMKGEIANAAVYDRPLTSAEISSLCSKEKRVKVLRKGFSQVPQELQKELDKSKDGSAPVRWAAAALRRSAENGTAVSPLIAAAKVLQKCKKLQMPQLAREFNKAGLQAKIVLNGKLAAFVLTGKGTGIHPAVGIMDLKTGREIFGERSISWSILWSRNKSKGVIHSYSPEVVWNSVLSGNRLNISWHGKGKIPFEAKSEVVFTNSRVESDLEIKNNSVCTFDAVKYPVWHFASLGKKDFLVHPYMSGVLVQNPMYEQFRASQTGTYPSGRVTMQFGAYCNQAKEAVYFAFEDPDGYTKSYNVEGKRNNLNVSWQHPVIADKGKNNFKTNGKAVIETYRGSWYEAGAIYRRFLETKAVWWIKELPRKSTPEWFRNNTLWIRLVTKKHHNAEQLRDSLVYLRSYFGLPYAIHWYEWNDGDVAGWPHFPAKRNTPAILKSLKQAGIKVLPYADDRLWRQKDGPGGKSDWKYSSEGKKYAALNKDGSLNIEDYGKGWVYTVMCPAAKGWQDILVKLTERLSDEGFSGLYHDQVGTAAPKLCYDRTHGHPANAPQLWLQLGYWKIFDRIFAILRKKNPDFSHTTEENAEPYLKQFDGYLAARWTDAEQIPLFQSIYSGRVQFTGRIFNCLSRGSYQSFFSKLAQQLVNAEQLGWFQVSELDRPDHRRLFVKKAMYVRFALLKYFNEGRRLAPIGFNGTMKYERCVWSGYVPHAVTMPRIPSSAWRGSDGSRMWLFVNSTRTTTEVQPGLGTPKGFWICREGAAKPVFSKTAPKVNLKGLTFEVWIEGSFEQAMAIQRTLQKISTFDFGQDNFRKNFKKVSKRSVGVPGKFYGVSESAAHSQCKVSGKSHFGWVQDGALIDFGEIDFGSKGAKKLTVKYAVDAAHAGGSVDMTVLKAGKKSVSVAASIKLGSTGSWKTFKNIEVPLSSPLTGKYHVIFRINGNSACNLAGWKYN